MGHFSGVSFIDAMGAVGGFQRLLDYDGRDFESSWAKLGILLSKRRLAYEVVLEGKKEGWGHPVIVVAVMLARKPGRKLTDSLANIWFDIDSTNQCDLRLSYRLSGGDTVPLFDTKDGVGIRRALRAISEGTET